MKWCCIRHVGANDDALGRVVAEGIGVNIRDDGSGVAAEGVKVEEAAHDE